jgi:hypothetical protein
MGNKTVKVIIDYRSVKLTSRHMDVFALAELLSDQVSVDILCAGIESSFAPNPSSQLRYIIIERAKRLRFLAKGDYNRRKMHSFYRWAGYVNTPVRRAREQCKFIEKLTASAATKVILGSRQSRSSWSLYPDKNIIWVHSKSDLDNLSDVIHMPVMSTRFNLKLPKFQDLTWSPVWGTQKLNHLKRVHMCDKNFMVGISGVSVSKLRRYKLAIDLYHSLKNAVPGLHVHVMDTPNSPNYETLFDIISGCKIWIDLSTDGHFLIALSAAKTGAVVYSQNPWAKNWAHSIDSHSYCLLEDIIETLHNSRRVTNMLNYTLDRLRAVDVKAATSRVEKFILDE